MPLRNESAKSIQDRLRRKKEIDEQRRERHRIQVVWLAFIIILTIAMQWCRSNAIITRFNSPAIHFFEFKS